ncbi:hypothetical protein L0244_10605 [bacterium]|nr:hypothetical protein [bacterium]
MNWEDAISYIQTLLEKSEDYQVKLVWRRLQLGNRTQDLLQTIIAMKSLEDNSSSNNPA